MFVYEKNEKLNISFGNKTIPEDITPDIIIEKDGDTIKVTVGDEVITGKAPQPTGDIVIPFIWDSDYFATTSDYTYADVVDAFNAGRTVVFDCDEFGSATLQSITLIDDAVYIFKTDVAGIYTSMDVGDTGSEPIGLYLIENVDCSQRSAEDYDYYSRYGFTYADLVCAIDLYKQVYDVEDAVIYFVLYNYDGSSATESTASDYEEQQGQYIFQMTNQVTVGTADLTQTIVAHYQPE